MRTPPKLAIPPTADAVTDEVRKLLRAADIGGVLPTPKERIIETARLIETGAIDLAEFEASRSERLSKAFYRALDKVLGFMDRRTREVYVDPDLHDSRKLFVTYHEVMHRILPWQHVDYTEDDNATLADGMVLNKACDELFECEANFGAADILFQCDRFEREARDYDLSVPSALYLAERYGASCHSSLRRFVERNHRACLLLVATPTRRVHADGSSSFFIAHAIPSPRFIEQFGDPFTQPFINPDQELGRILNNGHTGEIALADIRGFSKSCCVEVFSNQYRYFVMIYPKSSARARRHVILRAS